MTARYIVGIDLGTTNSAMARCDATSDEENSPIEVCGIPQLVNSNEVAERTLLPSFLYIPGEFDFPKGSTALPWDPEPKLVIGELARKRGAESPNRLVASAKSWLSHSGVNRTGPILPWQAPEEVSKLSPIEASSQFLQHLRTAWDNGRQGEQREGLEEQDVLLTVPASFDEEARELTRRAAAQAGLQHVTLLEEPQAAFYAWLETHGDAWRSQIRVGDLILVCDIGGGTTDFSLIAVSEENGELILKRVAVGEHILLGGDNMDLALARILQQRLEASGNRVDTWQLHGLWHQCRVAKEKLFASPRTQSCPITLLGKGAKLIGGTIKTELARADLDQVLVKGFFPDVASSEFPGRRRGGFQELGLPYAADPAITKHLARFLSEQVRNSPEAAGIRRGRSGLACPTHVLFNGGVMKASVLRNRVVEVLNNWLTQEGVDALGPKQILEGPDLEHAVARGAAYYGKTRRGHGVRIRSGASRTYYIGIESAMPAVPGMEAPLKALCVVPFGMEEGTEAAIPDREFGLVVGEPAEFRFLNSSVRKQDKVGTLLEDWGDEIEELGPLEVTLTLDGQQGAVVPVRLETRVTEIGTLEVWCVSRDGKQRWKLELNIRETTGR
ncbi:MAG TPA: Hsp70 family protein [Silvibacterium sp.]|nr:Hsp70 family protein [Silvibacterium sp.]